MKRSSEGRIAVTAMIVGLTFAVLVVVAARGDNFLGWVSALAGWSAVLAIRLGWMS